MTSYLDGCRFNAPCARYLGLLADRDELQREIERLTRERDELRATVEFCRAISEEVYPHVRHNLDAECAIRHIKRKSTEVLRRYADEQSPPVRSTRPCEICDGYHIIGSPCPVDGHRHY